MVIPSYYMGYRHNGVIYCAREIIRLGAIGLHNHKIIKRIRINLYLLMHSIIKGHKRVFRDLQSYGLALLCLFVISLLFCYKLFRVIFVNIESFRGIDALKAKAHATSPALITTAEAVTIKDGSGTVIESVKNILLAFPWKIAEN